MSRVRKAEILFVNIAIFILISIYMPVGYVYAATITNVPIETYTCVNYNIRTYKKSDLKTPTGWIYPSDKCKILNIYSDGTVQVKYPVARGYRTAYASGSYFFKDTNFSNNTIKLGEYKTAYNKSSGSGNIGTVYPSDNVKIVGYEGSRTQVIYPVSNSSYKMGWIDGNYVSNGNGNKYLTHIDDGYYYIKSAINQNYVIDVYGLVTYDGGNVMLNKKNGGNNQIFYIKKCSDGYYTITAKHSGKLLDVEYNAKRSGANVSQCVKNGQDNQKWAVYRTNDGYITFEGKSAKGFCLDAYGAKANDGTNIDIWEDNSTIAQKFVLEKADSKSMENVIAWAQQIANDNSHGYSQKRRNGNPDYDCSSYVLAALKNSGFDIGSATYTENMRSNLTARGFIWIPMSKNLTLKRGDILLNEKKHTEIYTGNNQMIGAHQSYGSPQPGDQSGREISVIRYSNYPWDGVLRYVGN